MTACDASCTARSAGMTGKLRLLTAPAPESACTDRRCADCSLAISTGSTSVDLPKLLSALPACDAASDLIGQVQQARERHTQPGVASAPSVGAPVSVRACKRDLRVDVPGTTSEGADCLAPFWALAVHLENTCTLRVHSAHGSEGQRRAGEQVVLAADSLSLEVSAAPQAEVASPLPSPLFSATALISPASLMSPKQQHPFMDDATTGIPDLPTPSSGGGSLLGAAPLQDTRYKLLSQLAGGRSQLQRSESALTEQASRQGSSSWVPPCTPSAGVFLIRTLQQRIAQ